MAGQGRFCGFEPLFDNKSKVLILGSFPSVKSRGEGFYYGNRQNRFWRLLASFFKAETPNTVPEKREFCLSRGIALWDTVKSCEIEGSLDSKIKNYEVADLSVVLENAPIGKILLNGGKSAEIFFKYYQQFAATAVKLPSTSPLNTKFDEKRWVAALGEVFEGEK